MQILRRFLVIQAFMLWQGGFVFYAAVVVPIGTDLSSVRDQGFVTQQVTNWINYFGVAWCLIYLWELMATKPSFWGKTLSFWRKTFWQFNVMLLVLLFGCHYVLDMLIDNEAWKIRDPDLFRSFHIAYLILSTIQWFISLASVLVTLWSWSWYDSNSDYYKISSDSSEKLETVHVNDEKGTA